MSYRENDLTEEKTDAIDNPPNGYLKHEDWATGVITK